MKTNHKHFKGEEATKHLIAARKKGAMATGEVHGTETPGHISAGTDSAKETAIILLGLWVVLSSFAIQKPLLILGVFSMGLLFWKVGRSSLLGWARLERLHRLIGQERWEIQHHRAQEKEELIAMYKQKGLSGTLLDQVVEILMADDNRLLQVMLEEELGLTLESFEHPLKQAFGAAIGVVAAAASGALGFLIGGLLGGVVTLSLIFSAATLLSSKREGNELMKSLIWNLSVGTLAVSAIYLLAEWASR